jgi:DNA-directed RNA polymerase specialized sigma24 family protein
VRKEELPQVVDTSRELPGASREAIVLHRLRGWNLHQVAVSVDRTHPAVAGVMHDGLYGRHALMQSRAQNV